MNFFFFFFLPPETFIIIGYFDDSQYSFIKRNSFGHFYVSNTKCFTVINSFTPKQLYFRTTITIVISILRDKEVKYPYYMRESIQTHKVSQESSCSQSLQEIAFNYSIPSDFILTT